MRTIPRSCGSRRRPGGRSHRRFRFTRIPILSLVSILALFALSPTAEADAVETLSLDRALEIGAESSRLISTAEAELLAADATAKEAEAGRLPNLSFSEHFSRTTNPTLVFSNLLGQERFTESNFDPDQLNSPDPLNNFATRLNLYQPLYAAGRISGRIDSAHLGRDAVQARRERTRQQVAHQIIHAYSSAVVARRQLEVAKQSKATALANIELVEDLYEVGLVVESDLLQARVRASEIEEMVVRSQSATRVTLAALNLAMGTSLDHPWELEELKLTLLDDLSSASIESLETEALENRPDRLASLSEAERAERQIDLAKAGWKPQIGLGADLEANGEELLDFSGDNWSVFVLFDVDVFDGFATRQRVARARQQSLQRQEMAALLAEQIGLEVRRAHSELTAAGERRIQATNSTALAEKSLTIVQDRYAEGLATLVELLEAETSLTRARAREVEAERDLIVATATLQLAVGRL